MQILERSEAIPYTMPGMPWGREAYPEMPDSIELKANGVNIMSYFGIALCVV